MTAIHRVRLESSTMCDLHCEHRESAERANAIADLHRAAAGRRLADAVLRKLVRSAAAYPRRVDVFGCGADGLSRRAHRPQPGTSHTTGPTARSHRRQTTHLGGVDLARRESARAGVGRRHYYWPGIRGDWLAIGCGG